MLALEHLLTSTLTALSTAIMDVFERFTTSYNQSMAEFDGRVASGELDLDLPLLDFNHLVIANLLYFAVLIALRAFMANREMFQLTTLMRYATTCASQSCIL